MPQQQERMPVVILEGAEEIARHIAERIAALIRAKADAGDTAVLGLATGSTPIGIYRELIRMHREDGLSFKNVITFNLDEYYPMHPESIHSLHRFMWENLFEHIDIDADNVHIPRGDIPRDRVERHCREFEAAIDNVGGIDYQMLGIGRTGHIGFNEPGSGRDSRTRVMALDTITRRTAAADFFGEDNVPLEAITMGVATIMDAHEVALIATGEHKAAIVQRAVEGEQTADVAATYLQNHRRAVVYLDSAAAAELTRVKTPWLTGEVSDWTRDLEVRALIWLSRITGKSVLKLDDMDYRDNHLASLLLRYGGAGPLNGRVFNALISKIRGRSKLPSGKRVVVFSPHPDDDVISAGGILNKLHQNGNDIRIAYMTSGNIAVFDHEVRRHLDFLRRVVHDFDDANTSEIDGIINEIEAFLAEKEPGQVDTPAVQRLKRRIREAEAVAGIETFGMRREQATFLNLPFYQTGQVRKLPVGPEDVRIVRELLEAERPELIFVAGDLSDPHGTHRMCMEAIDSALDDYSGDPPEVWYYRGAWQEWSVAEADVLVPLSEDELRRKILAIFKHQSQKDKAPFPGLDDREFWQRVEERNQATAATVDRLGLPEYFALEAYVVRRQGEPLEIETIPTSALASEPPEEDGGEREPHAAGDQPGGENRPEVPAEAGREAV